MTYIRHDRRSQFFRCDQRYHLAADFSETFGTAQNANKTFLVYGNDIAGIIPFVLFLNNSRLIGLQVTEHNVRAFDEQPSAFRHAFHFDRFALDARKWPADRTWFVFHRRIEGNGWTGLGYAITLHNPY